ncbi:hypothetical protein ALC57_04461 [Trachymyrmex cornetzi]|uniref:Regulatory protein zeste n=1 Tax=Trachymyrmex cornetzi TaxID=471704 RepID=A0A151JCI5_9HYME|nr:hypothetical protein ALC57_04461 [Trachymyrmex cornetzi]
MESESKNIHYTEKKRMLLVQLVSEEKDVIENKRTGATDLKAKTEAWERIVKKYCSEGCIPRTSKQLKKCWDNMKQKKKKHHNKGSASYDGWRLSSNDT